VKKFLAHPVVESLLGLILGLVIGLSTTWLAGENPFNIFSILVRSSVGSNYDLGLTIFYSTPLIFTGLAVALTFHGGMFNIGAEGQLTMGVLGATIAGVAWPNLTFPWAPLLAIVFAVVFAGSWAAIAGWLKAYRNSHEVIVTIMLNFIAAGLASWVVLYKIPSTESQNPESAVVGQGYLLASIDPVAQFFTDTPANISIIIAILAAIACWYLLAHTPFGFKIKAVGQNSLASEFAGIDSKKIQCLSFTIAGALAGLVAVNEVLGSSGRFRIGFSPEYGFMGIAVALLARNHPLGIIASAFLFGALHKGTSDLDMETASITRDFSKILQAIIILSVSAHGLWIWLRRRNKNTDQKGSP
jgi:general nucleoside transport system permease protein